ncbi:hypothetical protein [Aminobacter sp. HY435]|uniref:hypothetical protein n=1 Tax=Aminobacter sp. HY435 TaxID=2970917 RepID=UPI0022B96B4A|nr:hypothetical protein [Aminobacter sp. HY435]
MTDNKPDATDEGAGALPLAPVVDMASWYGEAGFADLPMLAPSPLPPIDHSALGEILADSLFGEVIEISDLLPQLLASGNDDGAAQGGDLAMTSVPESESVDLADNGFLVAAPFTILFEEDGPSGHGTL